MILKIEEIRKEKRVSITTLCRSVGISRAQYWRYVRGVDIPLSIVERILTYLGYKLIVSR